LGLAAPHPILLAMEAAATEVHVENAPVDAHEGELHGLVAEIADFRDQIASLVVLMAHLNGTVTTIREEVARRETALEMVSHRGAVGRQ
ncbi:hypothetical protein ACLOJK_024174, partial [Asimina triloba]